MTWQTWRTAMTEALYGPDGFYRRPAGPAAHFRTSVHASPLFAAAVVRLARSVAELAGPGRFTFVDLGAGRGELLRQVAPLCPDWRLVGVDVVDRPEGLPGEVEWCNGLEALGVVPRGFLLANEWLDNLPVDVVEDGRLVEVDRAGAERVGGQPSVRDLDWLSRWGDPAADRTEVGWPRDDAWVSAVAAVQVGAAVAVDYPLVPRRHGGGTLTGYRDGRQVPPVPDGSCDLTSHVLLQSCAEAAGGDALLLDQRTALGALGVTASLPPREQAAADPGGYLQALASASAAAELIDRDGLGGFGWLVQARGLDLADLGDLGHKADRLIGTRGGHR